VTVVLLECLYRERVFVRVGYYVSNENPDDPPASAIEPDSNSRVEEIDNMDIEDIKSESEGEDDMEEEGGQVGESKENVSQSKTTEQVPAAKKPVVDILPSKIRRYILEDKPRVTRFAIEWDSSPDTRSNQSVNMAIPMAMAQQQ